MRIFLKEINLISPKSTTLDEIHLQDIYALTFLKLNSIVYQSCYISRENFNIGT